VGEALGLVEREADGDKEADLEADGDIDGEGEETSPKVTFQ